jgi:N-acetylglucosamine malate deacetylase 1
MPQSPALRRPRLFRRLRPFPASALSHFSVVPAPTSASRILFLAPHPDDEALAAGGYLARAAQSGAECQVLLVTDGDRRGLKEVRAKEFDDVLESLGIPHAGVRLDFINGGISPDQRNEVQARIAEQVAAFGPDVVISPHPADLHGEHRLVSQIARTLRSTHRSFDLYEYLIHYPPIFPWPRTYRPHAALLPPPNLLHSAIGEWQVFPLDLEETKAKCRVVEKYPSQLKTPILRGLMYALIRRNELFHVISRSDA